MPSRLQKPIKTRFSIRIFLPGFMPRQEVGERQKQKKRAGSFQPGILTPKVKCESRPATGANMNQPYRPIRTSPRRSAIAENGQSVCRTALDCRHGDNRPDRSYGAGSSPGYVLQTHKPKDWTKFRPPYNSKPAKPRSAARINRRFRWQAPG